MISGKTLAGKKPKFYLKAIHFEASPGSTLFFKVGSADTALENVPS
jgi:hypothetical protein